MKILCFISAMLLVSCGCLIVPPDDGVVIVRLVRVIDGDTFVADIEHGYPKTITKNISVRLRGIDTPELSDKDPEKRKLALEAKEYLKRRLTEAKHIELRNLSKGKYFRIVADVYADGSNLSRELLAKGYAKPYNGGKETIF